MQEGGLASSWRAAFRLFLVGVIVPENRAAVWSAVNSLEREKDKPGWQGLAMMKIKKAALAAFHARDVLVNTQEAAD
jgi:hypothetical protein